MALFLASVGVFLLAFLGLALGVLCGREPLRGSCGGVGRGEHCICAEPCPAARRRLERRQPEHAP